MDGQILKEKDKPAQIQVRASLIQATIDTIKAGIRLDETEVQHAAKEAAKKTKRRNERKARHQKGIHKKDEEELQPGDRNYRAYEDRRFGFMIIGDQHRFAGKDTERFIFPEEPPLDYSFCLLNTVDEIVSEQEPPQVRRSYKHPKKTPDDRYITSSLRLSYNILHNLEGLVNILYKILEPGPFGLCFLDLSFNSIDSMDEDTFIQLPNLSIFYLHGNKIADMLEAKKLCTLPALHTLTLHGNPIENEDAYRISVLFYMPNLRQLDFFAVTKGDRANAARGHLFEQHWEKKHVRLVEKAKQIEETREMSLTARLMQREDAQILELLKE